MQWYDNLKSKFGFIISTFGVDRAVAYTIIFKSWQSFAGLISILCITRFFTIELQGFYYTFASLIALLSFFELGLYLVVSNFASHEWSKLHLTQDGYIEGDSNALSRLVSLGRFIFKWYALASLIFMAVVGCGGYWFLEQASTSQIVWRIPWLLHIIFSSCLLWCMPFLSLLEGCDQIPSVSGFRLVQAVLSNIVLWVAIFSGLGLWAIPALSMVSAVSVLVYLLVIKQHFFAPFRKKPVSCGISWKTEIFPMQWRLALQGAVNYFVFSLFTPVMFYYHGAAVAGQMGMTWQLVTAIQSIAVIWVMTKAPRYGILVARREFDTLDREWRKATIFSVLMMVLGVISTALVMYYLSGISWEPMKRVLSPLNFLLLAGGALFSLIVQCFSIYLRAHKKEVFTPVALITGLLMAIVVWQFGASYGALGATTSYLIIMGCVTIPMTFFVFKKSQLAWHK